MARPRAKSTTPQFSFRIDPGLRADLELLAADDDRSLGYYIERVLRQHRDSLLAELALLKQKNPEYLEYQELQLHVADSDAPIPPESHTKDQAEEAARILKFAKRKAQIPRSPKRPAPKTTGA